MRNCLSPDSNQTGSLRLERHGEVHARALIAHAGKGVLLDSPADAEPGRDLFHSHHAHAAIQGDRGRPGTKSAGINEDIAANSLSGRAGNLRDPVDPLAAEIHRNSIVCGTFRRRQNPHWTPQCQSLSLPPFGIHRRHPQRSQSSIQTPRIAAWRTINRRGSRNWSISATSRALGTTARPDHRIDKSTRNIRYPQDPHLFPVGYCRKYSTKVWAFSKEFRYSQYQSNSFGPDLNLDEAVIVQYLQTDRAFCFV